MMITRLTENVRQIVDQDNRIQRYLKSLEEKVDFTPRSWLYDGLYGNKSLTPDEVLNKWVSVLKDKLLGNVHADGPAEDDHSVNSRVYQFDTAQIAKWGPQGGHAPMSELLDSIVLPSFRGGDSDVAPKAFGSPLWRQAKQSVKRMFADANVQHLRPAAYEKVLEDMRARDVLESNSGLPDFQRRNLPEVKQRALSDALQGKWKEFPALALFRTYNGKTRLVWMYPMSTNLVEGSFYQPAMNAIMAFTNREFDNRVLDDADTCLDGSTSGLAKFFSPWRGFEAVRYVVTNAYDNIQVSITDANRNSASSMVSVAASDFSSTDAHFQRFATEEVYDVMKEWYVPEVRDQLHESLMWMHQIPLVINSTEMVTGWHGVSSGSNWTNFIETIFDLIFGTYVYLVMNKRVRKSRRKKLLMVEPLYSIGDDSSYVYGALYGQRSTPAQWLRMSDEVKQQLDILGKDVGQEIKAEKTTADYTYVKSLQRLFIRDYRRDDGLLRGVYSTIRALKSSVYPERYHNPKLWSKELFCARQFMILENCVDHPLFKEFVEFVCKGNKHLIPFAKLSAPQLERIQREAKLVPGLNSTYNQEKRDSSLSQFESIRIAREL